LEVDPRTGGFKRDEEHPFDCDLLVLDEASMVDVPLMRALLRAFRTGRHCCWWLMSINYRVSGPARLCPGDKVMQVADGGSGGTA
jgi:hypothetical protein